jgi:hypothetical protein
VQLRIGSELRRFGEKLLGPLESACGLGREARPEQTPRPRLLGRRQSRGALQRSGCSRDPGAPLCVSSYLLECRSQLLVRRQRGRRELPRTPIHGTCRLGEDEVGGAALGRSRRVVDRRPRERVREAQPSAANDQASPLRLD